MRESEDKKASHVTGKTTVAKANWLKLVQINWEDENGKSMTWEAVERMTGAEDTAVASPAEPSVYGVAILPILQTKGQADEVMLITQFRPPIGKMCVETPAGLVGKGEDMHETAWRELKEETGLTVGHMIDDDASYLYNDPGITDAGCKLLVVAVDADEASNKAALERGAQGEVYGLAAEGEAIRQLRVPLQGLRCRLNALTAEGYAVDGKLHCFARGLEVAQKLMK